MTIITYGAMQSQFPLKGMNSRNNTSGKRQFIEEHSWREASLILDRITSSSPTEPSNSLQVSHLRGGMQRRVPIHIADIRIYKQGKKSVAIEYLHFLHVISSDSTVPAPVARSKSRLWYRFCGFSMIALVLLTARCRGVSCRLVA